MKRSGLVLIVALILCLSTSVFAQTNVDEQQGMKPYDSFHGGDLDSVSLTSGGLMVHVPLVSFPQRGALDLSFSLIYNNKQWAQVTKCDNTGHNCTTKWTPMPRGGVLPFNASFAGPVTGAMVLSSVDSWLESSAVPESMTGTITYSRSVVTPDGSIHQLGTSYNVGLQFPMRSIDASGLLHSDNNTLIFPNGIRYTYPNSSAIDVGEQPTAVTDPNGNQITINSSGWTDTLGRLIPGSGSPAQPGVLTSDLSPCPSGTVSARNWDIPSVAPANGGTTGTRRFKLCYSNFTISTNFGVSGVQEYGPVTTSLLSAVVLPDGTMWTLNYDNSGNLTRLGFPTGGSISYGYNAGGSVSCSGGASAWVSSRTVDANDGTGGHTWTYSYSGVPASMQTTVTSPAPDNNTAVHVSTGIINGISANCSFYETEARYYQGAATGTPLKTVDTQYSEITDTGSGFATSVVPTQVTVTWAGQHSSKAVNQYDSGTTFQEFDINGSPLTYSVVLGSVLQKDEYDFSNALARSTFNHYKWQDDANYKNANLLTLPVSSMVKNAAGCELAKTSNGFDETYLSNPLQLSGVTMQHVAAPGPVRGNHTSTSRWLISACAEQSSITSHTIPYDTGEPYQSYDPLNHLTQYTYDPAFYGAYLTQTNMPDTVTGGQTVHHIISGTYDFNTGLLTRFTDENSQNFTYTYDDMLRLTHGNHPDGGQTTFTYPDPNTVTRQELVTNSPSNVWDTFTAKFDGLGRTYQTQHITPLCTVLADTTYDVVGRVSTVSNPYCSGSNHQTDPTYGLTTSSYDGLSRVTQTQKQDGSVSQAQYNQTAGDGDTTVDCTLATDEAGKTREVCNDGLGRMVKVLEPNPGAQATNATASLTISGTEQTANSQPATSGQATITITGAEDSTQICGRTCITRWDTGTVTITVNGVAKTFTYGQFDTPATVAWNLSCDFHNDLSAPADAPCPQSAGSSTTVDLTARATGAASNYSFTTSSATNLGSLFSGPSFFASPASGTMTGGQDASSTPDTGTVTVTVNGSNYQVSYGAGDTSASIALNLANAISVGTWANATASGSQITLTSKTSGTAGDYSLSASYTWNTTQFTNPSFTTGTSGSSLSGALDTSAINNQPFVTVYQYDLLNNLTRVDQKGSAPGDSSQWRTRLFTYDSLSRLITALNPETGAICYGTWSGSNCLSGYDADGNLLSKTSPAANQLAPSTATTVASFTYDALNRVLTKSFTGNGYTETTPTATYGYDLPCCGVAQSNDIGHLAYATYGNTELVYQYDTMGRTKAIADCPPSGIQRGFCYSMSATYNQIGGFASLTYPDGSTTINYTPDTAGQMVSAVDSAHSINYVTGANYTPAGMLSGMTNGASIANVYQYNQRLQICRITASTTGLTPGDCVTQGNSGNLLDLKYDFHIGNGTAGSGTDNGNVWSITNYKDTNRTQTFTYDVLNRLATAQNAGTNCAVMTVNGKTTYWGNSYTYDAWGNLTNKNQTKCSAELLNAAPASISNQLPGFTYDIAGNMVNDASHGYTYDAENRITKVDTTAATYTYNPLGNRVRKDVGSASTEYFYFGSIIIAELNVSTTAWTNYTYFNGQRVARRDPTGSVFYYFTDIIHSSSVVSDSSGTIKAESDYYPWGGELQIVNSDTNHYKFTGKERDSESQLDYFGARYYGNALGRFMSPDWADTATAVPYAEFGDPQSLNLYSYVRNSPIARFDADGHMAVGFTGNGVFYVGGYGVDDGSGGLADGDNPYADADQVLFVNAQGMFVVVTATSQQQDQQVTQQSPQAEQRQGQQTKQQNQNQPQTILHAMARSGRGGRSRKGERNRTAKPDKPIKGAQPIRDKSGKITGWSIPSQDGKRTSKSLEWGKANGLDPKNFQTAAKVGVWGTIAILFRALMDAGGDVAF